MEKKRSVYLILISVLILSAFPSGSIFSQDGTGVSFARQQALKLIEVLSPAEKVGQLFLLTFDGAEISAESPLFDLIQNYHIGGVVLQQRNGNIPTGASKEDLRELIASIQTLAQDRAGAEDGQPSLNEDAYIPLFIGASQIGGSYPYDDIFSGLSPLPSPMAIGATWDANIALSAGEMMGGELESVGVNLLLGPPMDVLDITYTETTSGLGVRTFGGDPYWVGKMGAQYITGLHRGSNGRLAVIAKHFPGRGATDRLPDQEVATVRKSLEQLKIIELAPFFRISEIGTAIPASITDGLMTSHIRYQGFQGNIRATTKPVSFDQNAIDLLMSLSPLKEWRNDGGLLVSDDLGSQSINRFFNPNGQFIDGRQIAKNAFLAGNDLLYIDELISTDDKDRFETYRKTIEFFQQKYLEDAAFAEKVDESVVRILTIKFEIYGAFNIERVVSTVNAFPVSIDASALQFQIARKAATLIDPTQSQLSELITAPPQFSDRIIIFTDSQTIVPCEGCEALEIFPVNELQKTILGLYGPDGSGQISANRIVSYSFRELSDYLTTPINRPELNQNFSSAKWVIFALREITPGEPGADALQQLIAENQVLLQNKHVIVFSFDAPYYFDATEISAFTAYYALYSKLPAFIEVAARILFQEINPTSASPVSIPGIGYDLIKSMNPDPNQIIPLEVDIKAAELLATEQQAENSPLPDTPVFKLGDILPVITGSIRDHNGNPVPDGTIVTFTMGKQGDATTIQQVGAQTTEGIAKASFALLNPGMHEIKVVADPAVNSEILVLDISEQKTTVSEIIPTLISPVDELESEQPGLAGELSVESIQPNSKIAEWALATLLAWLFGLAVYFIIGDYFLLFENFLISGSGIVGGLVNTVWMLLNLPGTTPRVGANGFVRLGLVVLLGVVFGAFCGWILLRLRLVKLGEQRSE